MIHNTLLRLWLHISGFDKNFYLGSYVDVVDSRIDPYYHFFYYGIREGRFKNIKSFKKGLKLDSFRTQYPDLIQKRYLDDFDRNLPTKFQKNDICRYSKVIFEYVDSKSTLGIISVQNLYFLEKIKNLLYLNQKKQTIYLSNFGGSFYLSRHIFFSRAKDSLIFLDIEELNRFLILFSRFGKLNLSCLSELICIDVPNLSKYINQKN